MAIRHYYVCRLLVLFSALSCCRLATTVSGRPFPVEGQPAAFNRSCAQSQQSQSYKSVDSPQQPAELFVSQNLKVCPNGPTCCTEEMENQFLQRSQHDFRRLVQDSIISLMSAFKSRSHEFDRFFRELLAKSQRDLDAMFMKTYGLLYEQNSDLFVALFDNFTSYYTYRRKADGTVLANGDLDLVMDKFYENLYRRMFRMLNQPYQLDDNYWQCMSRNMDQLQPFGQVPEKMKLQVLKSFSAARTFIRALTVGSDVVSDMLKMKPSAECLSQLTRMLHCQYCQGLPGLRPCADHCLAVTSQCLLSYMVFDRHWNEYLDSLMQLLDRLEGPYNIESVINPIDIQISEAIMIFQDRGKEISDKVFAGCGRPKMTTVLGSGGGRRSRRATRVVNDLRDLRFGPSPARAIGAGVLGVSMDLLAKQMKEKTVSTRSFWRHLPETLCTEFGALMAGANATLMVDSGHCWNGTEPVRRHGDQDPAVALDPFDADALKHVEFEATVRDIIVRIKRTVAELRSVLMFEPIKKQRLHLTASPPVSHSSVWKSSAKLAATAGQQATSSSSSATSGVVAEPTIEQSGYGSPPEVFAGSGGSLPFDQLQTDDEDLIKQLGGHQHKLVDQAAGSGSGAVTDGAVVVPKTDDYFLPELTTVPVWLDNRHHPVPDFEVQVPPSTPFLLRPYSGHPDGDYDVFVTVKPSSSAAALAGRHLFSVLLCCLLTAVLLLSARC